MGVVTGLLVGGAIANGVMQVAGAKKASDASKDAARMQMEAADKASKINDDVYGPYVRQAQSARQTLGRLTTPGGGARYAAPDPGAAPAAPAAPSRRQTLGQLGSAIHTARAAGGDGPFNLARGFGAAAQQVAGARAGAGGPQAPPGMVLMEAPDGSGTRPVPEAMVEQFQRAGARRVG